MLVANVVEKNLVWVRKCCKSISQRSLGSGIKQYNSKKVECKVGYKS